MQVRWNEWRYGRTGTDADTSDIAPKEVIVPYIYMMVAGVAGRRDGPDLDGTQADDVVIFQDADAMLRDRRDSSPQPCHVVAKSTRG